MTTSEIINLFTEYDKTPDIYYRASDIDEDPLTYHSKDIGQTHKIIWCSDKKITPNSYIVSTEDTYNGKPITINEVYRKGVYAVDEFWKILNPPEEGVYYFNPYDSYACGGPILYILQGKQLPRDDFLCPNEVVIKPEKVLHKFSFNALINVVNHTLKTHPALKYL